MLYTVHIIPDEDPGGLPVVNNGPALCKIHHVAFDQYIIGVTSDYQQKVRTDILEEIDGSMLRHGFQELHDQRIILPKSKNSWPDREKLDWRHHRFLQA